MTSGRLLALDDDPDIGQTIALIAQASGLVARATVDPQEFFRLIDEWSPTHIALDLVMPEMDGVQVIGQLGARGCAARLIIMSGVGDRVLDAAQRSAAQHGLTIAGILAKPFTPTRLRALLQSASAEAAVSEAPAAAPGFAASARPAPSPATTVTVEDLRAAIASRALHVVYQPKVRCDDGALAGFEALARWQHPTRGAIPPDVFVPLAEQHGLIDELTDVVLDEALDWFARHFVHGAASGPQAGAKAGTVPGAGAAQTVTLSINLSARTLAGAQMFERLVGRCRDLGVAPDRIIFELTETSAMEDPVASLDLLTRLRMKGFLLSIDDFGSGYSSMLQLVRLPFSEIKVDKSFVMTALRSPESRAVIGSILGLARSLGLRATAEGVEDQATLDYLKGIGCDLAQGYHIARPMDGQAVQRWLGT